MIPRKLWNDDIVFHINPTGKFVVGGPHGDTGLTGRKIIVDSYGGRGAHGGGAFSGKDPSKVDRSACYMGRYIAKNIVAAGLATSAEVQLAYAIGVAQPVSVTVSTENTAVIPEDQIAELVKQNFPLTPRGIIKHLSLLRPIYKQTARHGHFGRIPGADGSFSWEKTDKGRRPRQGRGDRDEEDRVNRLRSGRGSLYNGEQIGFGRFHRGLTRRRSAEVGDEIAVALVDRSVAVGGRIGG